MDCVYLWFDEDDDNSIPERIQRKIVRDKSDIMSLNEKSFVKNFRLNKNAFMYVFTSIEAELNVVQRSTAIAPLLKLAATLKILAQGGYQHQIGQDRHLGISQQSMSSCFSEVLHAIEKVLCPKHIVLESSEEKQREARRYFYNKCGIPGVIGAVDGTHIQIIRPTANEHLYFNRKLKHSINAMAITLPAQPGTMNSESRVLTIHVPASALQENQLTQILTAHLISSIMSLPTTLASSVLQQHVNAALVNANMQKNFNTSKQMDGALETSDEDESEESDGNMDDDDNDDLDKDDESDIENEGGAEEEPLNSEDDVTDEDASDLFDTDNVIVCQYDKITRSRNKWKFYLKDGIMNIGGKDYVFQKSNGDAEW